MKKAIVISNAVRNLTAMSGIILLLSLLCANTTTSAQQTTYDILPDTSCNEIEITGEPELYVGDDLFNLINGGAELYHEFGFLEVLAAGISISDTTALKVEIYDMGSPEAAWGIYSLTYTSNAKPFMSGVAGRKGEGFAQFIKDKYMVYIYFDELESTELQYLAGCIHRKIEDSYPAPGLMKAVQTAKEDAERVAYFKGNLGLSSIYNFHYKDVFGYKDGAAAIYPDLKVFLLNYEDEAFCIDKYNGAEEFFMNSSKYHDQITLRGSFHMKDRKERQIDCYFENTFLVLFISSGENDLNEIRETIVLSMEIPVTGDR
jgi:hypothetical protein